MWTKSIQVAALGSVLTLLSTIKAETTSSANGIVYNCPNVETIEMAYSDDCELYPPNSLIPTMMAVADDT